MLYDHLTKGIGKLSTNTLEDDGSAAKQVLHGNILPTPVYKPTYPRKAFDIVKQ
jgi:hypothetical protein